VLLILAGEGEGEEALRERAAPYGDRVRFIPSIRGHVQAFLSACDLLVFAPSPLEGEPRAIVMAQLVGVPVIATAAEGAEELIGAGAGTIVSPAHDPIALAAAIDAYRVDPGRRIREGYTAREQTLETHDFERTLSEIESALGVSSERHIPAASEPPPRGRRVWRRPSRRPTRGSPTSRKRDS
jgi:glycosyltransferase involved in cell wall biosynthesis